MGLFILGILVGWLAEWLFFTFWVKNRSTGDSADCAELRSALNAKNKEIVALKASANSSGSIAANKSQSTASTSTATKRATKVKAPAKPAPAKKAVAKKSITANKSAAKKPATPKKAAPRKIAVKKTPAKKAAPAKKLSAKKSTGDDLTKLSGIGPSMSTTLGELGIDSYKKLAAMDDDILRDMLEASGARLNNNKEAMDSWNEQATLADKGDFTGLKKLQDDLKN